MENSSKTIRVWSKTILIIAFVTLFGLTNAWAQKGTAAPKFSGSVAAQKKLFKAFIIKNVGKRVSLKLTFGNDIEPYGYRSEFADPLFEVDNYRYFLICNEGDPTNVVWTDRCKSLNWNNKKKTLNGFFKITEPDPKMMRTNRTFELTPVK